MVTLRDGTETQDRRLDRLVLFDERSRQYPIRAMLDQTLRSKTWRMNGRLDQGSEGACVGFSLAHELRAAPKQREAGVDATFAREKIYWPAQGLDPWPGGAYPGASPFYEGTAVLAGVKVLQNLGFIQEYRWGFDVKDLALAIGQVGPAVLGINWYEGMFEPDETNYVHATGEVAGGHAILCRGVSPSRKRFTLSNSWGRSWGINGDCYVTFDDMERLLAEDGEACIPLVRS